MRISRFLLIFIITGVLPLGARDVYFQRLGGSQGLSQSSAISFWQDPIGRIWIGNDALNCYDGESVKVYRVSDYFPAIEDSNVHTITGNDSVLFVVVENQLICFDLLTETLHWPHITTTSIYCEDNALYYYAGGALYQYNYATDESMLLMSLPEEITSVTGILTVAEGTFWLGTTQGIYIVDTIQKRIIANRLQDENITVLFKDSHDLIWVACSSRRIYLSTLDGEAYPVKITNQPDMDTLPTDIYCFEEDLRGNIWVGTLSGVFELSRRRGRGREVLLENHIVSESTVFALLVDRQGSVWIGPYYGDVCFFNPETDNYHFYKTNEDHQEHLHGVVIGTIVQDKSNVMYIATEGSGINILKPGTEKIEHLNVDNGLPGNKIRTLWYDEEYDRVFISVYMQGMYYLDVKTQRIHAVNNGDMCGSLQRIVEEIHPYQGNLILLTQNGIFRLDRKTLKVSHFFEEPDLRDVTSGIVRTIYVDDRNVMWVSSFRQGLFTINLNTKQIIQNYGDGLKTDSRIPSAIVNVCGDTKKGLFLSTLKSGILSYDAEKDSFSVISEEDDAILSDICYNMVMSWYGNLVVTTNKGVSVLILGNENQIVSSRHLKLSSTFPLTALSIDCGLFSSPSRDRIWVGGLYGMISFSERELGIENTDYNLFFSSLSVNNEPVDIPSEIQEKSLYLAEKITLPYNKSTPAIRFASSNYLSSHSTRYEYKLEGLEDNWIETDYKTIIYNSLRPGSYKLTVRESDNVTKNAKLLIVVKPPLWATKSAMLLYVILFLLILWGIVRFIKSKKKLQFILDTERKEVARIEEANRHKLDFFVSLSNEFRTPLTLILTQLDRLSYEIPSSSKSRITKIWRQTVHLQNLITEFLDFRKLEKNRLSLKVKYYNLTHSLQEVYNLYSGYAAEKQIIFRCNFSDEPVYAWIDLKQIQKVIYNLISFVLKESAAKSVVTFSLRKTDKWVEIRVIQKGGFVSEKNGEYLFNYLNDQSGNPADLSQLSVREMELVFSKGIILLHKGRVEVTKEEEGGEQVRNCCIRLQMGNAHLAEELQETRETSEVIIPALDPEWMKEALPEEFISSESEQKNFRMLLIENNREVSSILKETFSLIYEVVEVSSAKKGYEYAVKEMPDIILSEIDLPDMPGTEMCQMLRSNIHTLCIPVVLLSSQPSEGQQTESIRSGADDYIVKPFNIELLFLKCNHLVYNRRKMKQTLTHQVNNTTQELTTNVRDQKFMTKANQILEENLSNTEFNTTIWSRELNIGRTRLFNQIKEITGMTPNDYILHVKMNKSISLLKTDDNLTISEIAYQLGFANPAYFSKYFKKQFGVTPAEYKKR